MSYQNVLVGITWQQGQYRVTFQKTIFPKNLQETAFQDVEVSPGYSDKVAILGPRQLEKLVADSTDGKTLLDEIKDCSFFLLHRVGL
jgi:hypothetical protein